MRQDEAELVAVSALAWLAGNDSLLPVFLGATGASGESIRTGVQDPVFLGSVLDFVLMDDAWIMALCDDAGLGYDVPGRARAALPGGNVPTWT
ncbi:DUF3572 domain-containing protein [Roseitranquillus sediminis]|uniref:DUF3572 domain-containing protein n=1 Tax=Roseitranquillus sediminis TaxID=2809051 RepID=UPI001D0BF9D9|nr:DUF3572 domain-containing protein [Roseitranquillus sediminis]MBM9593129.1 DUF3572 domain-containing protein [Roseitranquillus sediminis]